MIKAPRIRWLEVESINIEPGETLTIWAKTGSGLSDLRRQIEVRVLDTGACEIFCNPNDVRILSFDEWYTMEDE